MAAGPLTTDELDAAVRAVLTTGQSYTLANGTVVTRANLASIQELRRQVAAEQTQASQGGMYIPVGFGEPG